MLTKEQIENNKTRYLSAIDKYGICETVIIEELGEKFGLFLAPASTTTSMHNAFPGGLIDHALRVGEYAVKISKTIPSSYRPSTESILKVSLLHVLGKINLFIPNTSEWHVKNLGKIYEFNPNVIPLKVGERSIQVLFNKSILLTDEEFQAIINHDKDSSEDKQAKYFTNILGIILKQAIELAIYEEKEKLNEKK